MKYYIFCSTASSNTTDLTHTGTHAYTHVRTWVHTHTHTKAMSCESRTVSCAPHPPTFSHLTIDKSRRQVQTVVHVMKVATAQPRLHTLTHPTHSRTCVHAHIHTNTHNTGWDICQQGTRGLRPHESKVT